jgi:hypothetical protein
MHYLSSVYSSVTIHLHVSSLLVAHHQEVTMYSGPSSYDRLDIRTTWVTTKNFSFDLRPKILVLTFDQSLELRPALRS